MWTHIVVVNFLEQIQAQTNHRGCFGGATSIHKVHRPPGMVQHTYVKQLHRRQLRQRRQRMTAYSVQRTAYTTTASEAQQYDITQWGKETDHIQLSIALV